MNQTDAIASTMTGERLVDLFLEELRHNRGRAELTIEKYRQLLVRLERSLAAKGKHLVDATSEDLTAFCGIDAHIARISPRSRRPMVAAVRVFYAWLARKRIVKEDIAAALTYPDAGVKYPGVLSISNAERLMMAPDVNTFLGLRDAAIIAVVLGCGLRASEVVGMNQGDLQFSGHDGREVLDIMVRGKRNRERIVPAPPEVWALVRAYLGHDSLDKIDRSLKNGDAVLFISTRNGRVSLANYFGERRRLNRRAVFQIFDRYARRLGIPKGERHPHAARHRFATELAEGGASLDEIRTALGHSSISTTQIYLHLAMRKRRETIERANPLAKVRTPVTALVRSLSRKRP